MQRMQKAALILAVLLSGIVYARPVPQRTLDDFFRDFTTQWMRANPNLAASTRYFTGAEQDRLEREIGFQHLAQKLGERDDMKVLLAGREFIEMVARQGRQLGRERNIQDGFPAGLFGSVPQGGSFSRARESFDEADFLARVGEARLRLRPGRGHIILLPQLLDPDG